MSKVITSPVKRWPGEVVLSDPLTLPQALAVEKATDWGRDHKDELLAGSIKARAYRLEILPALCKCVEEWRLQGLGQLTAETFPGAPANAAAALFSWLFSEVMAQFVDDVDPNA